MWNAKNGDLLTLMALFAQMGEAVACSLVCSETPVIYRNLRDIEISLPIALAGGLQRVLSGEWSRGR
jgi:hypothetical protein